MSVEVTSEDFGRKSVHLLMRNASDSNDAGMPVENLFVSLRGHSGQRRFDRDHVQTNRNPLYPHAARVLKKPEIRNPAHIRES